jgi:trimethylamine:corrinoid methyltransferase-like protein
VLDAEAIGMVKRLLTGMQVHTETLAAAMFEGINFKADFLKQKITRELFAKEQYLPSPVIDRDSLRSWRDNGSLNTLDRAIIRTRELVDNYRRPESATTHEKELLEMVSSYCLGAGMDSLPKII